MILGRIERQYLRHDGPEHVLCFAPTRSGKGVGLVVPTLPIGESMPNVTFSARGNTSDAMKKAEGKEIPLVTQARNVPAGVVRLMELQEKGWSYVRP